MTVLEPRILGATTLVPVAFRQPGPDNATANDLYVYTLVNGIAGPPRPVFPGAQNVRPVGDLVTMEILDADHWWVTSQSPSASDGVQARPAIAATADGGAHWSIHEPAPRILFMTFRDGQHGYALAVEGRSNTNNILGTEDGGAYWSRLPTPDFAR